MVHSLLRPCLRPAAAEACGIALEPAAARRSGRTASPTAIRRSPGVGRRAHGRRQVGLQSLEEPVGLVTRVRDDVVEVGSNRLALGPHVRQPQSDAHRLHRPARRSGTRPRLRSELCGVDGLGAIDDVVVDRRPSGTASCCAVPHSRWALVSFSQNSEMGIAVADEPPRAERAVRRLDDVAPTARELRMPVVAAPRPRVAEPDRGEDVERRRLGPAVRGVDHDADVVGRGLRVLDARRRSTARRTRRCRPARTRRRHGCARGSPSRSCA